MTVQEILSDKYIQELIDTSKQVWDVEDWNPGCAMIRHNLFKIYIYPLYGDRISIKCLTEEYSFKVEFDSTEELKDYIFHAESLPSWVGCLPIDLRRLKPVQGREVETCIIDDFIQVYSFEYGCGCEPMDTGFNLRIKDKSFSVTNEESLVDAVMILLGLRKLSLEK